MRRIARVGAWVLAVAVSAVGGAGAAAGDAPPDEQAPGPTTKGKVFAWKSSDGLQYFYYVPESYDAKAGANLTIVLHGSNLDRSWTFLNHQAGAFRPDDVVVSPDGTTPNGQGGHNFLQSAKDLKRLHALHEDLKKAFKVNATFVYGHSQGSFFSFLYAGAYPEDVQGVLGQASGVWIGTAATAKHQAIALMHGTADPVVPYGQSLGGLKLYRDAKYPLAHLRSLESWEHWPSQDQAAQELAWCEGMTSSDPKRVVASFAHLDGVKEARDYAALYQVAKRLSGMEGAAEEPKRKAAAAAEAVERLAKKNVEAIETSLGKEKGDKVVDAEWVAMLPMFLRDFDGVPSREALAEKWKDRLEKQESDVGKAFAEYRRVNGKDDAKAFDAGVEAVRVGFLQYGCADADFLAALAKWKDDAKRLKLTKLQVKAYDQVVVPYVAARKSGVTKFLDLNKSLDG